MKTVTLYRPRIIENALNEFDRYMGSILGDGFLTPADRIFGENNSFRANYGSRGLPSVDVRETEKSYILEAELPGFDEKEIEIRLDSNELTIESKKEEEKKEESDNRGYLIRERRVSSFSRSFKLPENADSEGVNASFKNGILSLEIQKKAEAQARLIQISKN